VTSAEPPDGPPGRVERVRARADELSRRAQAARDHHASLDVSFRVAALDKRVAAAVLAGGLAYRFFFWLLPVGLILGGALGFADSTDVEQAAADSGVGETFVEAIGEAAQRSQSARWWLLLSGVVLLVWTGYMAVKALVLVHALVWDVPAPRVRHAVKASLVFSALALVILGSAGLARWLRNETDVGGLAATLGAVGVPFAVWTLASLRLPHRGAGWMDVMPGALLLATGTQAFHLFVAYFLGPKLSHSSELYGGLGLAATALFFLYLLGRLVAGAAVLNVSLYERRNKPSRRADP
jgi:uncharacterized BrkB/YihY/UPF0761 family membrane protein